MLMISDLSCCYSALTFNEEEAEEMNKIADFFAKLSDRIEKKLGSLGMMD